MLRGYVSALFSRHYTTHNQGMKLRWKIGSVSAAVIGVLGFVIPNVLLEDFSNVQQLPAPNTHEDALFQHQHMEAEGRLFALGYQVQRVKDTSVDYRDQCGDEHQAGWIVTSRSWWFFPLYKTVQCGEHNVAKL